MPARPVALIIVLVATAGTAGPVDAADDACCIYGGTISSTSITSWAAGTPGGGVRRPGGPSGPPCTPWASLTSINPLSTTDLSSFRIDPDGVVAELAFRDCSTVRQLVWVRHETALSLSRLARDDVRSRALVVPTPSLSPPGRGIVNLETWLAVTDPGPISARAAIPGLAVTATAAVASTTWDLGNGDRVTCDGVGVPWTPDVDPAVAAPCGYTFRSGHPGHEPFRITVTITWQASWHASNGASGNLGTVDSLPLRIDYPVHEIQTIGVAG